MADSDVAEHTPNLRWLREDDFQTILELDRAIFKHPWHTATAEEILIRRRNLTLVVERCGVVVGFMVFEMGRDRFYIIKMGTLAGHRRRGVGTAMMNYLKERLDVNRKHIEMDVRESLALDGGFHFFQSHNFRGAGVHRDFFQVYTIFRDEPIDVEDSIKFIFVKPS